MIRAAIVALAISPSMAMADPHEDIEKTKFIIHASVAQIVCGINIPEVMKSEFRNIAYRYGFNEYEFATEISKTAVERANGMTALQKNEFCNTIIYAYRNLGVLR